MHLNEKGKISLVLFGSFLIFYALQIPYYTSKPDVIVFAIRSLADKPITDFAYLPQCTILKGVSLPNYHLGHTLILWLVYQIFPITYSSIIWASGFISALSGSLIVVLTFILWQTLGIDKVKSITIAVIVGLIPSFWEESVIGEVYALQFMFVLLFIICFVKDRIFLSSLFFTYANLVSPLSGLAFGLIFLKGFNKETVKQAIIVGGIALIIYLTIYSVIGTNLLDLLNPSNPNPEGRGIEFRIIAFVGFIVLNFNFFAYYLFKGTIRTFNDLRKISLTLILATLPQLLLIFTASTFFIELGSFQLPVFWALAFPLGYYISSVKINKYYFVIALIGAMSLSYTLWIRTNIIVGKEREDAGKWLRINGLNEIPVIAPWSVGVSIVQGRNGSSLKAIEKYYIEKAYPDNEDILDTKKDELIIASAKKMPLRVALSNIQLRGLKIEHYNPLHEIKIGKIKKIYENDAVTLFKWDK